MANWIDIGPEDQFPPGSMVCATVQNKPILICGAKSGLAAINNTCPHAGKPLADGEFNGRVLTCRYHGYAYDVANGRNIDFPYDEPAVRTYPIRVTDAGRVEVQTPKE